MTTVTAVKRALEEAVQELDRQQRTSEMERDRLALMYLSRAPIAQTILANRLSDRGTAGNSAKRSNLIVLQALSESDMLAPVAKSALQWAIDQLTPPERA